MICLIQYQSRACLVSLNTPSCRFKLVVTLVSILSLFGDKVFDYDVNKLFVSRRLTRAKGRIVLRLPYNRSTRAVGRKRVGENDESMIFTVYIYMYIYPDALRSGS